MEVDYQRSVYLTPDTLFDFQQGTESAGRELFLCAWMVAMTNLLRMDPMGWNDAEVEAVTALLQEFAPA